jgi:hypothetical protein
MQPRYAVDFAMTDTNQADIPVSQEARGLSHNIGSTGFRIESGAHHPWDWRLLYEGNCIAGIDADSLPAIRQAIAAAEQRGRLAGMDEAAGIVAQFERPRMDCDDYTFIREAVQAILSAKDRT